MKIRRVEAKRYLKLRIAATIIDYGIYALLFFIYVYCVGDPAEDGSMKVTGLKALPVFAFWGLYFIGLEGYNQATPGHDVCGLIVVKTTGEEITFYDAFKRRIVDFIDICIYGLPALICIYKTPLHQRLGDLLADTLVVKKSDVTETEVVFKQ